MTLFAIVTLTACDSQPDAAVSERRSAAGEVLGGEITDDMLPLDTVRSTSPVERAQPGDRSDATPRALSGSDSSSLRASSEAAAPEKSADEPAGAPAADQASDPPIVN